MTVKERQWRAAGEEEQAGTAAFPYILYTSESLRYSCIKEEATEGNTKVTQRIRRGDCRMIFALKLFIYLYGISICSSCLVVAAHV